MLEFKVENMTCGHCVASITKAITAIAPDASVQADLESHRVTVTGNVKANDVLSALDDIGFSAKTVQG